ncbi:His-Xaa-Ser system protein HxsD [Microvirga massiliensis]|uniref:His-Xaa-Ser system protein HxsD n=1 Tax=Microvirga massiliensis TaxID=1033741 RepID=UPI00164EB0CC|nr:His-Xaa-Ser system protein HxsD [Microvirga massiliensis]
MNSGASFEIDLSVYPLEAVLRASYWLADQAVVSLRDLPPGRLLVDVRAHSGVSAEAVCERLQTALIDFAIRVDVERQTQELRTLIWRTAFAEVAGTGRT